VIPGVAPDPAGTRPCAPRALPPLLVDPDAALEPGVVLIRVHRQHSTDGDLFQLEGHGGDAREVDLGGHGRPRIALTELMRSTVETPEQVCDRLRVWSAEQQDLLDWLRQLRHRHGDGLRVMIADCTGWGIPWELLWLPTDNVWLGAEVPVIRWVAGAPSSGDSCSGEVVAYLDPAMDQDREVLARYGVTHNAKVAELMQRLELAEGGLGLVYVGAHGSEAESSGTSFVCAGISVFRLEAAEHRLDGLRNSAAMVFLNACHSASEVYDARNNDGVAHSFAGAFLRAGARAFLGTSGAVGVDNGREAARFLLTTLEEPGLSIAVALRDYRRHLARSEAAEPTWDRRDDSALLGFLYGFMYLYFGNPNTTLTLTAGNERR
jgi:CHAT domain